MLTSTVALYRLLWFTVVLLDKTSRGTLTSVHSQYIDIFHISLMFLHILLINFWIFYTQILTYSSFKDTFWAIWGQQRWFISRYSVSKTFSIHASSRHLKFGPSEWKAAVTNSKKSLWIGIKICSPSASAHGQNFSQNFIKSVVEFLK